MRGAGQGAARRLANVAGGSRDTMQSGSMSQARDERQARNLAGALTDGPGWTPGLGGQARCSAGEGTPRQAQSPALLGGAYGTCRSTRLAWLERQAATVKTRPWAGILGLVCDMAPPPTPPTSDLRDAAQGPRTRAPGRPATLASEPAGRGRRRDAPRPVASTSCKGGPGTVMRALPHEQLLVACLGISRLTYLCNQGKLRLHASRCMRKFVPTNAWQQAPTRQGTECSG